MFGATAFGGSPFGSKVPREGALFGMVGNARAQDRIVTNYDYVFDTPGWNLSQQQAVQLGIEISVQVIAWSTIESTVGNYDWALIDRWVDNTGGIPLHLAIAVIDSDGATHFPADLAGTGWTSSTLSTAFNNMLTALQSHLDNRLYILAVGNEADQYLAANTGEISNFATFLGNVKPTAKTLFGSALTANGRNFKFTTTFTYPATSSWSTYAAVHATSDLGCFTYYYPGGSIGDHFLEMTTKAGGPFVIQEIGFHSASNLGSDQQLQADIFTITWDIALYWDSVGLLKGITWWQLHDWRAEILDDAGLTDPLKSYFMFMGFRDVHSNPKLIWPCAVERWGNVATRIEIFRFRNDDGSETTATWASSENGNLSLAPGAKIRIRMRVNTVGDFPSMTPQLDFQRTDEYDWLPVK